MCTWLAGGARASWRERESESTGYTVTTGVWARSVLQDECDVDLGNMTWVLSGDEHVEAYRPPPNVVLMPPERSMEELLLNGEVARRSACNRTTRRSCP